MQVFQLLIQKLPSVGQVGLVMQVFHFFNPETALSGTGGSSHVGVLAFYPETALCETGGSRHAGVPV